MPPEPQAIGDREVHRHLAGRVGHVVQVTLRIGNFLVDGRMDHVLCNGSRRKNALHAAGTTQEVTDHGLGR